LEKSIVDIPKDPVTIKILNDLVSVYLVFDKKSTFSDGLNSEELHVERVVVLQSYPHEIMANE